MVCEGLLIEPCGIEILEGGLRFGTEIGLLIEPCGIEMCSA